MKFEQQATAYAVLSAALDSVYPQGDPTRPRLVGPDPSGFHVAPSVDPKGQPRLDYLVNFSNAAGSALYVRVRAPGPRTLPQAPPLTPP